MIFIELRTDAFEPYSLRIDLIERIISWPVSGCEIVLTTGNRVTCLENRDVVLSKIEEALKPDAPPKDAPKKMHTKDDR